MPPVLDPTKSKVDGLAFLGLSLARSSDVGHPDSVTHQTAFDFNDIQDRDYEFLFSTNDDGWLVGGGEPPHSYKLPAPDSAHVEIMRIGTFRPEWGGLDRDQLLAALQAGDILIPHIQVVPTAVVANADVPPELEIRFDMDYEVGSSEDNFVNDDDDQLPLNWQLRFLHNQLFRKFQLPSRFCPGAHHSTIVRKAEFRNPEQRAAYFQKCDQIVEHWIHQGVQPLQWDPANDTPGIQRLCCHDEDGEPVNDPNYQSGLYLFTDRVHITHHFAPNFLPPYTPEKRRIIYKFLKEQWDEATLSWQPVPLKPRKGRPATS